MVAGSRYASMITGLRRRTGSRGKSSNSGRGARSDSLGSPTPGSSCDRVSAYVCPVWGTCRVWFLCRLCTYFVASILMTYCIAQRVGLCRGMRRHVVAFCCTTCLPQHPIACHVRPLYATACCVLTQRAATCRVRSEFSSACCVKTQNAATYRVRSKHSAEEISDTLRFTTILNYISEF